MASSAVTVLHVVRRKRRITQSELGQACGVNQADISLLENGWTPEPKDEFLEKVAKALGYEGDKRDLLLEYSDYLEKVSDEAKSRATALV